MGNNAVPWQKGQSGNPAGRPKGAQTKVTARTREELCAYIEHQAQTDEMAHPVRFLVSIVTSVTSSTADRLTAATALLDRMLPKLKAVEISGDPDKPLTLTDATARQARIAQLLEKHTNGALGG